MVVENRTWGVRKAQQALAELRVTHEVRGNRLRLKWEWSGFRRRAEAFVSFRVEVPPHVAAALSGRDGNRGLEGLNGDMSAGTGNGNIEARGTSNAVRPVSRNGSITLVLAGLSRAYSTLVIASSGNRDVRNESGLEEVQKSRGIPRWRGSPARSQREGSVVVR